MPQLRLAVSPIFFGGLIHPWWFCWPDVWTINSMTPYKNTHTHTQKSAGLKVIWVNPGQTVRCVWRWWWLHQFCWHHLGSRWRRRVFERLGCFGVIGMEQDCKKIWYSSNPFKSKESREWLSFERFVVGHGMVCMSKKEWNFLRFKVKIAFISVGIITLVGSVGMKMVSCPSTTINESLPIVSVCRHNAVQTGCPYHWDPVTWAANPWAGIHPWWPSQIPDEYPPWN